MSAKPHTAWVVNACRTIEQADEAPRLEALAAHAGLSPHYFHRVFKRETGLTPHAYYCAHRERRLRDGLRGGARVTEAILDAGYQSNARFYEKSAAVLGMKPAAYRAGGARAEIRFAIGECSLGAILVAQSDRGVCAILLGDDPDALARDLQDRFPNAELVGGDRAFEKLVAQVVGFVEAPRVGLDLPLDIRGTAFQQRVWQEMRKVKPGETVSYLDLARRLGIPKASRAVGQAVGANPLAVAIPCHRVIRADGSLSGYRWGVERKKKLLERER